MEDDGAISSDHEPEPSGDIALEQPERQQLDHPPVGVDAPELPPVETSDQPLEPLETLEPLEPSDRPAARQRSLAIVRAAADLAERIENEARDAAAEQLGRVEVEVRRRRREIDERELKLEGRELELERVRQELERHREHAMEAAQALVERAHQEAAEKLEQSRLEAKALLEQAALEAEELKTSRAAALERDAAALEAERQQEEESRDVSFAPPPLSPEDLAAVSTLPRFGSLQRSAPARDFGTAG